MPPLWGKIPFNHPVHGSGFLREDPLGNWEVLDADGIHVRGQLKRDTINSLGVDMAFAMGVILPPIRPLLPRTHLSTPKCESDSVYLSIMLGALANDMKRHVRKWECDHANSVRQGFRGSSYGCGRKVESGDRCTEASSSRGVCVEYLRMTHHFREEKAEGIIAALVEKGFVAIYKCGAVFFK